MGKEGKKLRKKEWNHGKPHFSLRLEPSEMCLRVDPLEGMRGSVHQPAPEQPWLRAAPVRMASLHFWTAHNGCLAVPMVESRSASSG